MWWKLDTWTPHQASTRALSTVPGPWWQKRGRRLSTKGEHFLSGPDILICLGVLCTWGKPFLSFFTTNYFYVSCRFVPSFLRLGSWNVVMFVSFEQIKRAMMVTKKRIDDPNWDPRFKVWLINLSQHWVGTSLKKKKPNEYHITF